MCHQIALSVSTWVLYIHTVLSVVMLVVLLSRKKKNFHLELSSFFRCLRSQHWQPMKKFFLIVLAHRSSSTSTSCECCPFSTYCTNETFMAHTSCVWNIGRNLEKTRRRKRFIHSRKFVVYVCCLSWSTTETRGKFPRDLIFKITRLKDINHPTG